MEPRSSRVSTSPSAPTSKSASRYRIMLRVASAALRAPKMMNALRAPEETTRTLPPTAASSTSPIRARRAKNSSAFSSPALASSASSAPNPPPSGSLLRSEEHTSELQSPDHIVCRLLLVKKKYTLLHSYGQDKVLL